MVGGCSGKAECLCCVEQCCCKFGKKPICCACNDDGVICQLGCVFGGYAIKKPDTCCMYQDHCCCCVRNGAFPCNEEVPCMFGGYGCMCYPKMGFCMTQGQLMAKGGAPEAEVAAEVMER